MKTAKTLNRGFTLLELLVVIGIIAAVLAVVTPNLLGVRQRARDSKRKAELGEFKKALSLFYTDYNQYPVRRAPYTDRFYGCGSDPIGTHNDSTTCPTWNTQCEFAAGGADCTTSTMYMKRLPRLSNSGTSTNWSYYDVNSSNDFCLFTSLENGVDPDISVSQSRCGAFCSAYNGTPAQARYMVCAD